MSAALRDYVATLETDDGTITAGLLLMNPMTGEILCNADYVPQSSISVPRKLNVNHVNHWIGSTFKPILAASCLATYPALTNFQLRFGTQNTSSWGRFVRLREANNTRDSMVRLLGYQMYSFSGTAWGTLTNHTHHTLSDLMQYSLNVYPVALLLAALSHAENVGEAEQLRTTIHQ